MPPESARHESMPRKFLRWVGGSVLPRTAYPVVKGPLKGRRFVLGAAAGEGGGASVYVGLMEPEKTAALQALLAPGQTVFDIGANIGYYTVLAARTVGPRGKVFAFEPFARNLSYLYRHVTLNEATNVTVVPVACADRIGLSLFTPGVDCATGSLVAEAPALSTTSAPVVVATTTVDEVVRLTGATPDVLKIDVEGAEVQVLQGARHTLATARPRLLLGVHSDALRAECTALLASLGYVAHPVCDDANGDAEVLYEPTPAGAAAALP
jgi:FkbM family methyltransferase